MNLNEDINDLLRRMSSIITDLRRMSQRTKRLSKRCRLHKPDDEEIYEAYLDLEEELKMKSSEFIRIQSKLESRFKSLQEEKDSLREKVKQLENQPKRASILNQSSVKVNSQKSLQIDLLKLDSPRV